MFKDAGHILGSTSKGGTYNEKKIVCTGDLGNSPSPLLRDTEEMADADYLIMEAFMETGALKQEEKEKISLRIA